MRAKTVLGLMCSTLADVTNAGSIHRHGQHQLANRRHTTAIGIVGNELPSASFAAITLFLIGGCAILNNVP